MRRNRYLVNKLCAQPLDGPPGSIIVRVACNSDRLIQGRHEWCDCVTSLKRVTVSAMRFQDLESHVSRADKNVLRIAHPKVDVTDIRAIGCHNAEMVKRDKPT